MVFIFCERPGTNLQLSNCWCPNCVHKLLGFYLDRIFDNNWTFSESIFDPSKITPGQQLHISKADHT